MADPIRTQAENDANPQDRATEIDELVVLCIERIESEGDAALDRICAEHPAHASRLRACVAALRSTGMLGAASMGSGGVPEVLGDFRLLAPLGQGGMGIVYAAEQISLGRRVALKLIRPEQLFFGGARERFRREVDAVARLAHPNIVAIHQVGEERGIPFFAMELVEGASLADVVRRLSDRDPADLRGQDLCDAIAAGGTTARDDSGEQARIFRSSWVRACLAIVAQVAEALEHAHQRGVFHRDVKPSNVLITRSGRVLLVDFGLAALQGTHRLTQTGSQLGSLPYLPPEHIRDAKSGQNARSDVYSLGITLYELLTLHLPFHAETTQGILQKILDGRPAGMRERNRAVPPDAETVCLTAIDPDPARRYPSAAAFARDLANVLELRPIEARRASARLRLVRTAQRHPAWAIGLGASFLVVVVGPLVFALQERRARNEVIAADAKTQAANAELATALASVRAERDATAEERERAERNLDKALAAVDLMLTKVGTETLRELPQMDGVRRDLLEGALRFYEDLLADQRENGELHYGLIEAQDRVAELQAELGLHAEAERTVREELALIELVRTNEKDPERLVGARPRALNRLANALRLLGRIDEAADTYRQAILETEILRARLPHDPKLARDLARASYNLGVLDKRLRRLPEAAENLERALAIDRELAEEGGGDASLRRSQALTLTEISAVAREAGRNEDAERSSLQALDLVLALEAEGLRSASLRQLHGKLVHELAQLLVGLDRDGEAEARAREALAIFADLAQEHPGVPFHRNSLAAAQTMLAQLARRNERLEESVHWMDEAERSFRLLVTSHPDVPDYAGNLAVIVADRARRLWGAGDLDSALALVREAIELDLGAVARSPRHPALRRLLEGHRVQLADVLIDRHELAEAATVARSLLEADAPKGSGAVAAAEVLARCARAAASDGDSRGLAREYADAAVAALEAALERGFQPEGDLAADERFAGLAELTDAFARTAESAARPVR